MPLAAAREMCIRDRRLFAHLLDQQFQVHGGARDFHAAGLGAEGVGLAVHLLEQEVQALASAAGVLLARGLAAAVGQQMAQFFQVRAQARQFLGDVDAQREQVGFMKSFHNNPLR